MKIILHKRNIHIKLCVTHIIEKKYQKRPSIQSDFFNLFTIIIISRSILPGKTPNYRSPVDQHLEIHTLYEIDKSSNQVRLSLNISYNIKITTLTRNGYMKFFAHLDNAFEALHSMISK